VNTISQEVAAAIWQAHREIETATKLLAEIVDKKKWGDEPTLRDAFGRVRGFQFGVPMGSDGHRLFDVSPELSRHVIEAHIANKQRELAEACIAARMELDGLKAGATKPE